jgi:hypothetical protein
MARRIPLLSIVFSEKLLFPTRIVNADTDMLLRIDGMPAPRHLFVLPPWLESSTLERLIGDGYLTCSHFQRNGKGAIQVAMDLQLTAKGKQLIRPESNWRNLMFKGSLAGASFAAMSVLILYLG